jgi:hypothetical protein
LNIGELTVALIAAVAASAAVAILGWLFRRRLNLGIRKVLLWTASAPTIRQDQVTDDRPFIQIIESVHPRSARLIEFSSSTARIILLALKGENSRISLLVKHPESVNEYQRERILTRLNELFSLEFADYPPGLDVRCYREFASLRGRMLDDSVINVGWFTPTSQLDHVGRLTEVVGRSNPLVTATLSTPEGSAPEDMFDRVWTELWNSPGTEDAREVAKRLSAELN